MLHISSLSLALSVLVLACSVADTNLDPSESPPDDVPQARASTPGSTRGAADGGAAAAAPSAACGVASSGVTASKLPLWPKERVRKLIATPSRVLAMDSRDVRSAAKTGTDSYTYFTSSGEVDDFTVFGSRVFVLSKDTVSAGPVTGGELNAVMYDATGGTSIHVDEDYIYVASATGEVGAVYRGPHHLETDLYGIAPPAQWLDGASVWKASGALTQLALLIHVRENGAWNNVVIIASKLDSSVVNWGSVPGGVPDEFYADETQALVIAHDSDTNEDQLLAWQPTGTRRTLAHGPQLTGLAVDAEYAYFAKDGALQRIPRDGSAAAAVIFDGTCAIDAITVDAGHAYFATTLHDSHQVFSLPLP